MLSSKRKSPSQKITSTVTGEMLVGTVRVLMADEISTGLDSATTFSIVAKLKSFMAMRPTFLVRYHTQT